MYPQQLTYACALQKVNGRYWRRSTAVFQYHNTAQMENVSCGETLFHPRPIGYNIQFEPEKPFAPAPKRITEYVLKPHPSHQELERKLLLAGIRKKVNRFNKVHCTTKPFIILIKCLEQERLERIRRNGRLWQESSQHEPYPQAH